ncbi:MAG: hypothetical protein E5V77_12645, partial [Mesorhizobium sp.]
MVLDQPLAERGRFGVAANRTESGKKRRLQVGFGQAIGHHGELLQGVFEDTDGRLCRGLITLPFASRQSTATFWPKEQGDIRAPIERKKA